MYSTRTQITLALIALCSSFSFAQEKETNYMPEIHGTIRAKYEYQPQLSSGRFEVRNARLSVNGNITPIVTYKAEIDLSDEGSIKMLDAYTRLSPINNFNFTIGQMRVPFTIDAHRSPHQQYFANRSFIAKQVGNVRDVGATIGYKFTDGFPISLDGGLFNGSGLTNQKNFWTKGINYSAKAQFFLPEGFNLTLSVQKIKPEDTAIHMYDAGAYFHSKGWHVEVEYLLKQYANNAFDNVKAFDGFISYDLKLRNKLFSKISFLGRFDYMGDHSNGNANSDGVLFINDYQRQRYTGGVTLSLAKPFISDIRINYENYIYQKGAVVKPSEHDKFVIEFMTRF